MLDPIDRARFFSAVRSAPFPGSLSQSQVEGMVYILDRWESDFGGDDLRWLAYALATAFHETSATMQPISEYGLGAYRPYGVPDAVTHQVYFGRGLVQLTWKANYEKMSKDLGIDLVNKPAMALVPTYAAAIMFMGMSTGSFTGKGFMSYFNQTTEDPLNARRIINGTDQAEKIAGYYAHFKSALAVETPVPVPLPGAETPIAPAPAALPQPDPTYTPAQG
jgi:putative chitinase